MTTPPPLDPAAGPPPPGPDDEELLAAYVGPGWRRHYQRAFAAFRDGAFGPPINWAAVLAPQWLAFRGFWLLQIIACIAYWAGAFFVGPHVTATTEWLTFVAPYLVLGVIEGVVGDRLVHWRATRTLTRVRSRGLAPADAAAQMRKAGGVSIAGPVLIPVGSFGLLYYLISTIGHGHSHEQAYVGAMRSDLRNLVTAQEAYFADNVTYTSSLQSLYFTPSTGVTITIGSVTGIGWNAMARHNATTRVCGIYFGAGPPPIRGSGEGEPKCVEGDQADAHRH